MMRRSLRSTRIFSPQTLLLLPAVLVGIFVGFILSTVGHSTRIQLLGQVHPVLITQDQAVIRPHDSLQDGTKEAGLEFLSDMVAKTDGFNARDYSLWLGWNNMRYIIETAILHGRILNRTTVIPSFVYARACEFDVATCAAFATMVNRGDAVHSDEWRELPKDQQMAWRVPISVMFNLTRLQLSHAVITTSDYLRLHNISTERESSDGSWDVDTYHVREETGSLTPDLHVAQNIFYDPYHVLRVDRIPQDMRLRGGWSWVGGDIAQEQPGSWTKTSTDSDLYRALMDALPDNSWPSLDWDTVKRIVEDGERITPASSVEDIRNVLQENGFEVVYTYDGAGGYDAVKDVISPTCKAVPRHRIRGLYEDYHNISARVLLLRGEIHLTRKPGALHFTSLESRARFSHTVLYELPLMDDILALAERINERMFALNDGRLWMAAHMRRGDFMKYNFLLDPDFKDHFARTKRNLDAGRDALRSMHGEQPMMYDVPDARADPSVVSLDPPRQGDKFYIATDEREKEKVDYLREHGAVLISDLLTQEDYRMMGWPILLTDVLALVEQEVMARAAFFYAHSFTSVAGGVMNLRAGLGKDPRTARLE